MIKKILSIAAISILFNLSYLNAQNNSFIAGVSGQYNLPLSGLNYQYEAGIGYSIHFGKEISQDWTWMGKFEYLKLDEENFSKLKKRAIAEYEGVQKQFDFTLDKLSMEFESFGLSAEAKYDFIETPLLNTKLNFGFGFYYWDNFRSAYNDSLMADLTGTGELITVEELNITELNQSDWSGTAILGIQADINFSQNLFLSVGANYKMIIGELWPTLALDLENVSTFQIFEIRTGLFIKF